MNRQSIPTESNIAENEASEFQYAGDRKRIAWLAALALMAVVAGAALALLVDETPSKGPQVIVAR